MFRIFFLLNRVYRFHVKSQFHEKCQFHEKKSISRKKNQFHEKKSISRKKKTISRKENQFHKKKNQFHEKKINFTKFFVHRREPTLAFQEYPIKNWGFWQMLSEVYDNLNTIKQQR